MSPNSNSDKNRVSDLKMLKEENEVVEIHVYEKTGLQILSYNIAILNNNRNPDDVSATRNLGRLIAEHDNRKFK